MSEAPMGEFFSIVVTILIAGFLWFWIVRPILEDYGVIEPRAVKDYQDAPATQARVMSREIAQTAQPVKTDEPDGRVSVADQWLDRLEVDRTKVALIELLVYSGWKVEEMRGLLKGDNGVLGTEIDAARKRLGITPPAQHITPIVGRRTDARFDVTDADYPYQPIKN